MTEPAPSVRLSTTNLTFHEFLVEHVKFPFPETSIGGTTASTDTTGVDVGLIGDQWRPVHAVRDNNLTKKLCDALKTTLGETPLTEGLKPSLLPCFLVSTSLGSGGLMGQRWEENPSESYISVILVPSVVDHQQKTTLLTGVLMCTYGTCSRLQVWLTHFIGHESTGRVWKCYFDNFEMPFAVKTVEMARPSDIEARKRLRKEFDVYITLEKAYQSGQLQDRIAPRCYGRS